MLCTNEHLHFYLYRLQSQTKKILVYKTELIFKISKNRHFFSYSSLASQSRMVFSVGEGRNAAQLLCFIALLHMLLISMYSPHHMNTFYFFPLRN